MFFLFSIYLLPMSYILIIGVFEAVFLILLLISKKNKGKPDFYLGTVLGLYALSIFLSYTDLYNIKHGFPFPGIINLSWLVVFLQGPALWFYIKSLSDRNFTFRPVHLLHFLPFIVFATVHYYDFIRLPLEERIYIAVNEVFKEKVFYKIAVLSIGISTITYNLWALNLIKRYRKRLEYYFSKTDSIDLSWLRTLIIATLIIYLVNVTLFNLDLIFRFTSYKVLLMLSYGFASVYMLIIGFFGLKQKNVFLSLPDVALDSRTNRSKKPVSGGENGSFVADFLTFMDAQKPYLDPELSLSKLSGLLRVKPEYLSEILNSNLNQSFFDFINRYRIEEFKKRCIDESSRNLSIMGIAYDCGFNSKAAFYRAFKKFENISPTAYIQGVTR